jgi:hypothetical protein
MICKKQSSGSQSVANVRLFPSSLESVMFPRALQEEPSGQALLTPVASKISWLSGPPPLLRDTGKVAYSQEQPLFLPSNRSMLAHPRLSLCQQKMGIKMVENEADEEDFALLQSILCPTLDTDPDTDYKILGTGLAKRNLSQTATGSSMQCEGSKNEGEDAESHSISKHIKWGVDDARFKHQQPATKRTSVNAVCA